LHGQTPRIHGSLGDKGSCRKSTCDTENVFPQAVFPPSSVIT
jgi:hypothetical protein